MASAPQNTALHDGAIAGFDRTDLSIVVTNPHLDDNPIVYVNEAFTQYTGYAQSAVVGRNCRFLQGPDTQKVDVDVLRKAISEERSATVDILNYRATGEPFMNRLIISPIRDEGGVLQYFLGIQKGVAEGAREKKDRATDAHLELIQKRVAEDLSRLIGVFRLQSKSGSAPEEFVSLARRIAALELLYEEMQLSPAERNLSQIEIGAYVSRVAVAAASAESRAGLRFSMQVEQLFVPIGLATRIGLVVSELVTNAFLHAFERLEQGAVQLQMTRISGGGVRLLVSDDGVGFPVDLEWPNSVTTGGRIVSDLIDGTDGSLSLQRGAAGSVIVIDIPASSLCADF